jgi:hypothetical protein
MKRPRLKLKRTKSVGDALSSPLVAQTLRQRKSPKYHTKGGHGFSAEDANHLADILKGKRAEVVGKSNELNGRIALSTAYAFNRSIFAAPPKP